MYAPFSVGTAEPNRLSFLDGNKKSNKKPTKCTKIFANPQNNLKHNLALNLKKGRFGEALRNTSKIQL